jgi:hypothetical protein
VEQNHWSVVPTESPGLALLKLDMETLDQVLRSGQISLCNDQMDCAI